MRTSGWIGAVLALLVVAFGVWFFRTHRGASGHGSEAAHADPASQAENRPIPVLATPARIENLPIVLKGIGNAAAFYTVTVRTLVDGQLTDVLFREGQTVARGDVLAQVDPRPFLAQLHQAEGVLARDRGLLDANRRALARIDQLRANHYAAPQDYDTQQGLVAQYEGAVRADEASVESARLNLTYARITAPIGGVTGVRLVDPGNIVHPSDASGIVVITQLDPIAVFFTLPEDDLPVILHEMHTRTLDVQVFNRDESVSLATGTLALVDNQVNAATATIRLKAIVDNHEGNLWPQEFVKVWLRVSVVPNALVIPSAAIQRGPDNTSIVYVVKNDHAELRTVQVARTQDDVAVVTSGVAAGEPVVTDGQSRLRPGSRVVIRPLAVPAPPAAQPATGESHASHRQGGSR